MEVWSHPGGSDSKESAGNAGDQGMIPGSGESFGEGNGYPLHYSFLAPATRVDCKDPMDCSPPGFSVYEIFPDKDTGVGCHFLLQGLVPTQGSKPGRQILYQLSYKGNPCFT